MKHLRNVSAMAALASIVAMGCQTADTAGEQQEAAIGSVEEALFEASCKTDTTASNVYPVTITGTGATSCGSVVSFTGGPPNASYGDPNCPSQFLVELSRSGNTPIGANYYFVGRPTNMTIMSPDGGQSACESLRASYIAWTYTPGGGWVEAGRAKYKGKWYEDKDILFPCMMTADTTVMDTIPSSVPSSATKVRIAASWYKETIGPKGNVITLNPPELPTGIGTGYSCEPG